MGFLPEHDPRPIPVTVLARYGKLPTQICGLHSSCSMAEEEGLDPSLVS